MGMVKPMKLITKMSITVIVSVLIIFALFLTWYFWPRYVQLELVACLQNQNIDVNDNREDFRSEFHWCFYNSNPDLNPDSNKNSLINVSPAGCTSFDYTLLTNSDTLRNWGVNFDELGINFDKNNAVISFSRQINEMQFNRADWFPYRMVHTVKTIMSKKFDANAIYVYKILKYDVREDMRAYSETSVEK
ncbi:MAG: hypothetical protein FWC55_03860 [Firmicutes bacterium]|nr:hypothetical protein [Bacillota bacterium]